MKCPNCDIFLVMSQRSGIEIDYCPQCRGVWLDKGELDKIIERTMAENEGPAVAPPPPQNPNYQKLDPYNPHYKEYKGEGYYKKKKGGFLGDLFDFD